MDCIFCKIGTGDIPCYSIYEDEIVKVFLDAHPDSNGHTLIIPKEHYLDFDDIPESVFVHIWQVADQIKKQLEEKLHMDGVSFVQNNGIAQEIKHYHLHIKPAYHEKQNIVEISQIYEKIKESN